VHKCTISKLSVINAKKIKGNPFFGNIGLCRKTKFFCDQNQQLKMGVRLHFKYVLIFKKTDSKRKAKEEVESDEEEEVEEKEEKGKKAKKTKEVIFTIIRSNRFPAGRANYNNRFHHSCTWRVFKFKIIQII
jgi:hypothetical protein